MRCVVTLLVSLAAAACGSGPTGLGPTAAPTPSRPLPVSGASIAVLAVEQFDIAATRDGSLFVFVPRLRVAETSGRSGAWVTSLAFFVDDGRTWPTWRIHKRVAPSTARDLIAMLGSYPEFEFDSPGDASRISVAIEFTDDEGRLGSLTSNTLVSR